MPKLSPVPVYKGNSIKTQSCLDIVTWQNYWKQATESTSSSLSGLHFGHYRSQATDLLLSDIRCSVTNLAIRNSNPLSRWLKGLSIMLEKNSRKNQCEKTKSYPTSRCRLQCSLQNSIQHKSTLSIRSSSAHT